MGILIGIVVVLILLGALLYLVDRGASSRRFRPFIGLLLIGLLLAGMALLLGLISEQAEAWLLLAAKGVIVLGGVLLCLRLIGVIARRFFSRS